MIDSKLLENIAIRIFYSCCGNEDLEWDAITAQKKYQYIGNARAVLAEISAFKAEQETTSDNFVTNVKIEVLAGNRLDRRNAAKALGRTPKTLAEWKCKNVGPACINVGGRIFYDLEEVLQMARGQKPIKPEPQHD